MFVKQAGLVVETLKKCSMRFVYIERHPVRSRCWLFDVVVSYTNTMFDRMYQPHSPLFAGNLVPEELPEVRTALVQEIWRTLNNLNVPMDVSHYNALLRVYLENEHPFSPTEFLADLESKGVEPNR